MRIRAIHALDVPPVIRFVAEELTDVVVLAGPNGVGKTRLANASLDPTFLLADVEVVATYVLYNVNRVRLENLIHRVFDPAQLDVEIKDRFGNPIKPREWFLVPLFVVDQAIEKIRDGTITGYIYDPKTASLTRAAG